MGQLLLVAALWVWLGGSVSWGSRVVWEPADLVLQLGSRLAAVGGTLPRCACTNGLSPLPFSFLQPSTRCPPAGALPDPQYLIIMAIHTIPPTPAGAQTLNAAPRWRQQCCGGC